MNNDFILGLWMVESLWRAGGNGVFAGENTLMLFNGSSYIYIFSFQGMLVYIFAVQLKIRTMSS